MVHADIGGDVLILAAEDVTGISPAQGVTTAQVRGRVRGLADRRRHTAATSTTSTRRAAQAPHHLGVLSHYDAVVWETGDDIITARGGQVGGTAAKAALDIELSVRDYLNEGGKLLLAGKYARYAEAPTAPTGTTRSRNRRECTTPEDYPCLPLLNDFQQYWLGRLQLRRRRRHRMTTGPFPLAGARARSRVHR